MKIDTRQIAIYGLLIIISATIVFHVLILTGVIPFNVVWGGRLKTEAEMVQFETVSVMLNIIMLAVVATYAGILKINLSQVILKGTLWFMVGIFSLNTFGNLLSQNETEKLIFTPITLLLALFSLRLALDKEQNPVINTASTKPKK